MLTYEALAAGVDADRVLDDVLEQVPMPRIELARGAPVRPRELPRAPLLLGLLALVPLALVGLRRSRSGGARRFAVRYTNVDVLAAVAGRSWTRHVPAVLALLALAALLIALARPRAHGGRRAARRRR